MSERIIVRDLSEIEPLRSRVTAAAERTARALAEFPIAGLNGIEILRRMKFTEMARHPIAEERSLNAPR